MKCLFHLQQGSHNSNKIADIEAAAGGVKIAVSNNVKHIFAICLYKEPLELMMHTVDSLVGQTRASEKVSVIVGLELGTPDREEKAAKLMDRYEKKFDRFIVTVHPKGLLGMH